MKNKAGENDQVSHQIKKQMFKGLKIVPWHAATMMLHMAHYGRRLVFFGQAYAFSFCELSRKHYDRKLGRAKTWLIRSQS